MHEYFGSTTFTFPESLIKAGCFATFTCAYQPGGPYNGVLNMCNFSTSGNGKSSLATFDQSTGTYTLMTNDKQTFTPGDYTFTLTANVNG